MPSSYLKSVLHPESRERAVREAVETLKVIDFDTIVACGVSGVGFGSVLAYKLKKELAVVRKSDGSHSRLKVECHDGIKKYIIVDDLIDSGDTMRRIMFRMRGFTKSLVHLTEHPPKCVGIWLYDDNSVGMMRSENKKKLEGIPLLSHYDHSYVF